MSIIQFEGRFAHLAHRFLPVNVPNTETTWEERITADGARVEPHFIAFLESEVGGVSGWTWGDAIEAAEERGHLVDFTELPVGEFIKTQQLAEAMRH